MDPAGLHHRLVGPGDRTALASFDCTGADHRVEPWIRGRAVERQLSAPAIDDIRVIVFHEDAGGLVAISAHERNFVVVGPDGDPVPGSYLMLVAITDRFQGGRAPDGRRLIDAVLGATFEDIRSRTRGEWVAMMVQPENSDGSGLVTRLGATRVGTSGRDEVFVLRLG